MTDILAQRLKRVRQWLADEGLDGLVIWRADMFGGEEVRACDERLAMISGFAGSAGYAVILQDTATVVSDGRYHLELDTKLDKSQWQWRDQTPTALQDIMQQQGGAGTKIRIGFDSQTTSLAKYRSFPARCGTRDIEWVALASHPLDALWDDRPLAQKTPSWALDEAIAGQSAQEKLANLQSQLVSKGQDGLIITATDCVNWLFNIRGDELANTPFHLCFAFVPQDGAPIIIEGQVPGYECVSWQAFAAEARQGRYEIDPQTMPFGFYQALDQQPCEIEEASCPLYHPKACKNNQELEGFRQAHRYDGLSVIRFWQWLDQQDDITSWRETDLVARLQAFRRQADSYLCDSFETIMGSGPNGAIIHYRAQKGQDSAIQNDTLLLIDSGAHYQMGTTDITRTFAIGTPDDEMRRAYSAVLSSHIALAQARFPAGTTGASLDAICRAPLWARGWDYMHGTGHGVGHILSVHEGPAHISKRPGPALSAGMVLSNEPGYYEAGKWGIRLENLVAVQAPDKGFHRLETLTLVPFDSALFDLDVLKAEDVAWIDAYHQEVYQMLAPACDAPLRAWLADKCAPIGLR